jgi:hypothetical protein
MLQILYGIYENTIDVTDICFNKLKHDNIITIPYCDINRSVYFVHPLSGIKKSMFTIVNGIFKEYTENDIIKINITDNTITTQLAVQILYGIYGNTIDVTDICFSELLNKNIITIPDSDFNRTIYFTDPFYGFKKTIFVITNGVTHDCGELNIIKIDTNDNNSISFETPSQLLFGTNKKVSISNVTLKILYGHYRKTIDVTDICFSKLLNENIITIPNNDLVRDMYFSDPLPGVKKKVFLLTTNKIREYNENYDIKINTKDYTVNTKVALQVLYGIPGNMFDVTDYCLSKLKNNDTINIGFCDFSRNVYFPNLSAGIKKYTYVITNDTVNEYDENTIVKINTKDYSVDTKAAIKILYGIYGNTLDISDICVNKLKNAADIITIQYRDQERSIHFTDHLPGIEKSIFIITNGMLYSYDKEYVVRIHLQCNKISITSVRVI